MLRKNLFSVVCLVLALLGGMLAGCTQERVVAGGEQAQTQNTPQAAPGAGKPASGTTQGGNQTPGTTQSTTGNK